MTKKKVNDDMTNMQKPKTLGTTETSAEKQPYTSPVFHDYGQLHRVTQGFGSANGDAGQVMMP